MQSFTFVAELLPGTLVHGLLTDRHYGIHLCQVFASLLEELPHRFNELLRVFKNALGFVRDGARSSLNRKACLADLQQFSQDGHDRSDCLGKVVLSELLDDLVKSRSHDAESLFECFRVTVQALP